MKILEVIHDLQSRREKLDEAIASLNAVLELDESENNRVDHERFDPRVNDEIELGPDISNAVLELLSGKPAIKWTNKTIHRHLKQENFKFTTKQEIIAVNKATRSLVKTQKIKLLKRGKGRQSNVYCGMRVRLDADPG